MHRIFSILWIDVFRHLRHHSLVINIVPHFSSNYLSSGSTHTICMMHKWHLIIMVAVGQRQAFNEYEASGQVTDPYPGCSSCSRVCVRSPIFRHFGITAMPNLLYEFSFRTLTGRSIYSSSRPNPALWLEASARNGCNGAANHTWSPLSRITCIRPKPPIQADIRTSERQQSDPHNCSPKVCGLTKIRYFPRDAPSWFVAGNHGLSLWLQLGRQDKSTLYYLQLKEPRGSTSYACFLVTSAHGGVALFELRWSEQFSFHDSLVVKLQVASFPMVGFNLC